MAQEKTPAYTNDTTPAVVIPEKVRPSLRAAGLSRENRIMSIVLSSHTTETILSLVLG
jgi:hypothetical protein